jgi:signal transduction histidine kinase
VGAVRDGARRVHARAGPPEATVVTIALLRTAIGPLVALYVDARRRLLRALVERAERAERDRDLRAAQARADERARLAAEMHDAVTHQVSLMVLQAGALRVTATDDATREAAERVRAAGCRALDELRDLVGVLHAAPGSGQPPTADLSRLVDDATAAGTPIDLTRTGDPSQASPLVGRTIHRVVREALTNARKHAPGSTVSVRVDYQPAQVRVTVRNTAPTDGLAPDLAATGSGLGLTALRRRVETVHGTLTAGPTADGGYLVEAALPTYVPTPGPVAGELAEPEPTGTC